MAFDIVADQVTISAEDPEALHAIIRLIVADHVGDVITIGTRNRPDGQTITLLPHEPHHQPDRLYGAAFVERGQPEPDVALPVIAYDTIRHLHLW